MLTGQADIDFSRPFSTLDLASRRTVIAAVSGGSDSTALLLLLKDFLDRSAPDTRLVAVTVDHALRPGSAEEAESVARLCAELGVAHEIIAWTGPKPASGLPAAAREARYGLLATAAQAEGTDLILTGHTADDQAETVLMRSARETGRGLAGMAPATLFDGGVWIVRPLLGFRREALRDYLRQRGAGWIEDPTNTNEAYERPRMRAQLGPGGGEERVRAALAASEEAAERREALGREAAMLIRDHAYRPAPGLVRLDPQFLTGEPRNAAIYALRILLATVGGTTHLPDEMRAAALHGRLLAGGAGRAVLSRTLIDQRRSGIFLHREARDLPPPQAVVDGAVWDGRFRISCDAKGLFVGPVGAERARAATIDDTDIPASLVRAALAAEPALWRAGGQWLPAAAAAPIIAPWARFLPCFDLAPAQAMAALLGAPKIPAPPFREHNGRKA